MLEPVLLHAKLGLLPEISERNRYGYSLITDPKRTESASSRSMVRRVSRS